MLDWTIIAIFSLCALIQGAAGFAFSLFAVALLLMAGYDFPAAVAMTLLVSLMQKLTMIFQLRRSIQWRGLLVPALFMLALLPVGVCCVFCLDVFDSGVVKKILGGIVLFVLILRSVVKVHPHKKLHWGWGAFAGGLSGFFQGLINTGGPPIVLWSMAHQWPPERLRSVTPMLVILLSPFQIFMLNMAVGREVWPDWQTLGMIAPAVVLATVAGVWLGGRLRVDRLRQFITALLVILAVSLILDPLSLLKPYA